MSDLTTPIRTDGGRDTGGRFAKGNTYGLSTRYAKGKSGNRLGRPVSCDTWLRLFADHNYGPAELRRILANPLAKSLERIAARWALVYHTKDLPIEGADPREACRFYRRWYRKSFEALFAIFVNEGESPDRREAARNRLCRCWDRHGIVLEQ